MNRVVHVARDGLVGRDERRDVLHARAHAVNAQIERLFAGQADGARDNPRLLAAILHEEVVNRNFVEAARRAQDEAVKGLLESLAAIRREIERDGRVAEAARELSLEIAETREVGARIKVFEQRKVEMTAIEREVERLAALDLALEAEVRVVRELRAEIINLDVAAADGQRGIEAVDGERAIAAIRQRDAAIRPEIIDGCAFAMRCDIGMSAARELFDARERRRPCCRIRLHSSNVDVIGLDMRREALVIERELALARDLPAKDARTDVLQVEHAVQEPRMCRSILEGDASGLARRDRDVAIHHRISKRAANLRRDIHGACVVRRRNSRCCLRTGFCNRREQRRGVEILRARFEIHGRRRRIKADTAVHFCRLSLHRRRKVAADFAVREMHEALGVLNLDAFHIDRAVLDFALPDDGDVADVSTTVERRLCRLDLAAADRDAVGQQAIRNQRKIVFGIDI